MLLISVSAHAFLKAFFLPPSQTLPRLLRCCTFLNAIVDIFDIVFIRYTISRFLLYVLADAQAFESGTPARAIVLLLLMLTMR